MVLVGRALSGALSWTVLSLAAASLALAVLVVPDGPGGRIGPAEVPAAEGRPGGRAVVPTAPGRGRFDLAGTVLLSGLLVTLLLAVSQGGAWGWLSGRVLGLAGAAVLLGVVFAAVAAAALLTTTAIPPHRHSDRFVEAPVACRS